MSDSGFLAKVIDGLFIDGFKFDADNTEHQEIIKDNFVWLQNSLYIITEGLPINVLSFTANGYGIQVKHINSFTATLYGLMMKDEKNHPTT